MNNFNSAALCVVATRKRPAIILEALQAANVPHNICWTTDYKLEEGWKPRPEYGSLVQNQVGAMRCWRGHQDALKFFRDQVPSHVKSVLVMEDDAWPNDALWITISALVMPLLEDFEAVSLHGRAFRHCDFTMHPLHSPTHPERSLLVPKAQGQVWVQGSLAYMIHRRAVDRWIDDTYSGYPSDLYLCNRFKFALIDPSPFDHNRTHGSLIDCKTPTD
jgi:hypothetical protein